MKPTPNKITLDIYNEVLENVIRSVGDQWEKSGGDFNILNNISELWRYQTMKRCNIDSPEPQCQHLKRAKQKQQAANNDEFFKLLSGGFQEPINDDKNESSESSSSSQKSESDSGSELGDSDTDSNKSSGQSSSEESSDGLGDETDDEVNNMVTQIKARDTLFCEYTFESKKRKKGSKGFTLNVVNGHFTIDGIPRVVKNGTIMFT